MSGESNLELAQQWFKGDSHSEGACPKESSLLKTKAGLLRQKSRNDRLGFTLAEVLITLGIIGVVAALTLPSLINKFKIKQLKTAFIRSSSLIQNAMNETAVEFGYASVKDLNSICGIGSNAACRSLNQTNFEYISSFFLSRFKTVAVLKSKDITAKKYKFSNFSNISKNMGYASLYGMHSFNTPHAQLNILADGTAVTSIAFFYHEPSDGLSITFDTNGPAKGPNRYGYDIFLYNTGTWTKLCTKKQDGKDANGRGCYDYALKDVNPDDNTKGYWDSLY